MGRTVESIPPRKRLFSALALGAVAIASCIFIYHINHRDVSEPRNEHPVLPREGIRPAVTPGSGKDDPPPAGPGGHPDAAVLAGDVRDAATREPLAGVILTLQDYDDSHGQTPRCETDAEGRFRFRDLRPGSEGLQRVRLVARKEGYKLSDTYTTLGTTTEPVRLQPLKTAEDDR